MAYSPSSYQNPFGFTMTPWVKRLLIANGVVFIITLAFAGLIPYLAFTPADVLSQPWTPVTYMFVHAGLFHLLFNMLGLFFFGPPLEERWGEHEFAKFYLLTGLGGAALSLVFPERPIIGASAAIYGVLVAFAMYWPESPIYIWGIFPVKAKWLVTFMIALSIFSAVTGGSGGIAHLAHLGGAAAAFIYLKSRWAPSPYGAVPAARRRARSKWRVLSGSEDPGSVAAVVDPQEQRRSDRAARELLDDVDEILDKISAGGLSSLTDDERSRLDEASRRHRTN